ncbi:MAG: TorF family putative porin [Thioalkalispiraceae bacterium]|jgi:uncharacterized protein (TIGR02001 family)
MKLNKFNLTAVALAVSVASFAGMPATASAEVSASLGISNMYLWRGQNISNPSPAVSGSIDYSAKGGFYAGIWGSSEGPFDGSSEIDLYAGYGSSIGDFGYDVSYYKYLYPGATAGAVECDLGDCDLSDVVVSLSYGPVALTGYFGVESGSTKDKYYTLSGDIGKFTLLYGKYEGQNAAEGLDYSHVQVSYAFNDELSFTVSKASEDGYGTGPSSASGVFTENPLFQVSYSKSFDMK